MDPQDEIAAIEAELARRQEIQAIEAELARREAVQPPEQPQERTWGQWLGDEYAGIQRAAGALGLPSAQPLIQGGRMLMGEDPQQVLADEAERAKQFRSTALQGLTAGFGEEATAALGTLAGYPYEETLQTERARIAAAREQTPVAAMGAELVGGAPIAALAAPYAVGAAGSKAPLLARALKTAGTAAASGGAYGFGSGEGGLGERSVAAGTGALLAGGTAGLTTLAGGLAGQLAGKASARGPQLSRPQQMLRRELEERGTPMETLAKGARELGEEIQARPETTRNIMDVTQDPAVRASGRFYRGYPQTSRVVDEALESRASQRGARLIHKLDEQVPRKASAMDLQLGFRDAAEDTLNAAERTRTKLARPWYRAAEKNHPVIESEKIDEVLQSEPVKNAINQLRKLSPKKYGDLPDNHIVLLNRVKKVLDDEAGAAKMAGKRALAKDFQDLRGQLVDTIDSYNKDYAKARKVYQEASTLVNKLGGNKSKAAQRKTRGLLEDILSVDANSKDVSKIGRSLYSFRPQQIKEIKGAMGKERLAAIQEGAKGYLQDLAERSDEQGNLLIKFWKNDLNRQRVKAALGSKKFEELNKGITEEIAMQATEKKTFVGSPTFQNQQSKKLLDKLSRTVGIVRGQPTAMISAAGDVIDIARAPESAATAREIAKILVEPKAGQEFAQKAAQAMEAEQRQRAIAEIGSKLGARAGISAAGPIGRRAPR